MRDAFDKEEQQAEQGESDRAKQLRAIDFVRRFMVKSQEYRRPHLELAAACRDLYQCWVKEGRSLTARANLKLPYAFSLMEQQTPELVEAILKERPIAKVEGTRPSEMVYENSMNDFLDNQVDKMNFPLKCINYVKAMQLDGTAFAQVPYRYQEKLTSKTTFQDNGLGTPLEKVKTDSLKVVFDGPDFEPIAMVDFFPDWTVQMGGDIQSHRGVAKRTWRSLEALKGNRKYKNLDKLETSARIKNGEGAAWKSPYYTDEYQALYDRYQDNTNGVKSDGLIEVWEYWGLFDTDGKGNFAEYIITLANGDVVLRCEENFYEHKFKPFVATPNIPRTGEFYGVPELIAIKALIKESQVLRNARLDQVNIGVNRMYVVDRTAGIKARSLYSRPSGIIWANDVNGVRELPPPEIPVSATRELQELQVEMKDTLGMTAGTPQLAQAAKTFGRSATGVQYLNSISASRVGLKVRIIGETLLKPLYYIMLMTNDQFVTDEQWVKSSDPDTSAENPFTTLPAEAFQVAASFVVKIPLETGGQEADLARMQQLGSILQTAEATQPGVVKWDVFFQNTGRSLLGKRYKKFVRSDMERMQMQAQQLAAEQAAQAQTGATAPQPLAQTAMGRMQGGGGGTEQ